WTRCWRRSTGSVTKRSPRSSPSFWTRTVSRSRPSGRSTAATSRASSCVIEVGGGPRPPTTRPERARGSLVPAGRRSATPRVLRLALLERCHRSPRGSTPLSSHCHEPCHCSPRGSTPLSSHCHEPCHCSPRGSTPLSSHFHEPCH